MHRFETTPDDSGNSFAEGLAQVSGAVELSGSRILLRPIVSDDLAAIQRWRSDPEVTRYWITRAVPTLDDLHDWLRENERSGSWTWLILDETAERIGYINVFGVSREHRHAELAMMIGERSRWGEGYAREALAALLVYLLTPADASGAGLHKVSLSVFAENVAARKAYRACGFREDGLLREDMWYDGRWRDQILMSVLEDEFLEASSSPGSVD